MIDLAGIYNNFQSILCLCPHCAQINRLNEISLSGDREPPKTLLDDHDKLMESIDEKIQSLDSDISQRVSKLIQQKHDQHAMEFKRNLNKAITKVTPNPFDIIGIYNPIDGAAFPGMSQRTSSSSSSFSVDKVILFNRQSDNKHTARLNDSLRDIINNGHYDFKTIRWTDDKLQIKT